MEGLDKKTMIALTKNGPFLIEGTMAALGHNDHDFQIISYLNGYFKLADLTIEIQYLHEEDSSLLEVVSFDWLLMFDPDNMTKIKQLQEGGTKIIAYYTTLEKKNHNAAIVTLVEACCTKGKEENNLMEAVFLLHQVFHLKLKQFPLRMQQDQGVYLSLVERWMKLHAHNFKAQYFKQSSSVDIETEETYLNDVKEYRSLHHELVVSESEWYQMKRVDMIFEGYEVIVVLPKIELDEKPWIWRTEFFDAFSKADLMIVRKGYGLAYLCGSDLYGCDLILDVFQRFQKYIVHQFQWKKKAVLFGFSRGGFYALRYALRYPDSVSVLYLDAPVVDLSSWPYQQRDIGYEWDECCCAFYPVLTKEYARQRTEMLIEEWKHCDLPLILVAGDADRVVPWMENGHKLIEIRKQQANPYQLILKQGCDHHPHSLADPSDIVKFIEEQDKKKI